MISEKCYQWGYVAGDKIISGGWKTPNEAIEELGKRINKNMYDDPPDGFRLAKLHVTIEVISLMASEFELKK